MGEQSLSLYQIDAELTQLMQLYDEPDLTQESLEAIDAQIALYCEREVSKVDGIVAWINQCKFMAQGAKAESERLRDYQKTWEGRGERMKAIVQFIMGKRGITKLEGRTGVLSLKGNGGKQALTITNPELVPDALCDAHVVMPWGPWKEAGQLVPFILNGYTVKDAIVKRVPNLDRIRAELAKNCEQCGGHGDLEWYGDDEQTRVPCPDCQGTGRRTVPGVTLEPRGSHVEVR
jgi:hypothetical protein